MSIVNLFTILLIIAGFLKPHSSVWSGDYNVSSDFKVTEFSHKDLLKWETSGLGIVANGSHGQLIMSESQGSKGLMIISPEIYKNDVILSYDVMTLRPATVLLVEFLAHNTENYDLNFPDEYDGNVKYLFANVNMYMFAFHNAAHNKPGPFIRKYPVPGKEPLVKSEKPYMQSGIYYHVELGRLDNKLFLKIDGDTVLETTDPDRLEGGKLILRIRGTAHELASCLIRNVKIYSRGSNSENKPSRQ